MDLELEAALALVPRLRLVLREPKGAQLGQWCGDDTFVVAAAGEACSVDFMWDGECLRTVRLKKNFYLGAGDSLKMNNLKDLIYQMIDAGALLAPVE